MTIEQLERRRLFAITVSQGYPGYYEVSGDSAANQITVTVDMDNFTMTVNGDTYYDVYHVAIYGYGGDDDISLTSSGPGWIGGAIQGGEGDDILTLNFDGVISGGGGSDTIFLADSFYGEAYGDDGDDQIVVIGACVNAEIRGGNGNDLLDARGNLYSVVLRGGAGNDTIYGSDQDDAIFGDDGDDVVFGNDGHDNIFGSETIDGGGGYDVLFNAGSVTSYSNVEELIFN